MTNEPDNIADDLIERATAALRDTAVPQGPTASVLAKTLSALEAAQRPHQPLTLIQRIGAMKAISKLAAAAVLLITVGGVILWNVTSSRSVAFADVLKEIRNVQSVKYRQTATIDDRPSESMSGEMLIAGPSRMRFTIQGAVMIVDTKLGKFVTLDPVVKLASTGDWAEAPFKLTNILETFETFQKLPAAAGNLGQKQIDGVTAEGFEVAERRRTVRVWVNKETRLPVLAEFKSPAQSMMPANTVTFDKFVWNPPVDEAAMSMTPPEGYRVKSAAKIDMSPPTATDITAGLKAIAEINGGTYPEGIDMDGLRQVILDLNPRLKKDAALKEKMHADGPGMMLTIGRLWVYVDDAKNGSDWRYAGGGVKAGEADRPIFWYRPPGSANYRVINGDLSVHDVAAAAVPNVPSKLIVHPSRMSGATTRPQ